MEMDPERNILLVDTPAKYQVVNVEVLGVPINYGVKMKRMVGRDLKRISALTWNTTKPISITPIKEALLPLILLLLLIR